MSINAIGFGGIRTNYLFGGGGGHGTLLVWGRLGPIICLGEDLGE